VQAVGTLLLFALVVTPAATAIMLVARPGTAMAVSTVLAVVSVWIGLAVSAMFNVPPSFVIVSIVSVIWLVVWSVAQRTGTDRKIPAPAHGAASGDQGHHIH
jgi:zinc/manganese transport system permease protein